MRYISTRGLAPAIGFEQVMLAGLAPDGGLYVPEHWPVISDNELIALRDQPYQHVAFAIISRFTGDEVPAQELQLMINEAYASFQHPAIAPLKQLTEKQWLLELFHGPTLAFKDVAMQLLARLMSWALARQGKRATIVGATSGDTGGAAVEAFKASTTTDTFILHPHQRVSAVQRHQMTTVHTPHIFNIAIEGTFDDCQSIVKSMFSHEKFRQHVSLAGVNSINWARIMAQVVYYFTSALSLGAPNHRLNYAVPTGNFGDIFAGFVAKRMGLPLGQLIIATNPNDILDRTLKTGRYEIHQVIPSSSPSMDIQISSNFERLLYFAYAGNSAEIRALMASLKQSGVFEISPAALANIRCEFSSHAATEQEIASTIKTTLNQTGELLDPHTAVGFAAAQNFQGSGALVTLATAHPAKFPDAVKAASGVYPHLPDRLQEMMNLPEYFDILPNNPSAVEDYILHKVKR